MSIAGGVHHALLAGKRLGFDCVQIFVKNQRQWSGPPPSADQIEQWRRALAETGVEPVVAHATYLVNLAAADAAIRRRSIACFADEIRRCAALGVPGIVIHPGSHGGSGESAGIRRVVAALRQVLDRTAGCNVTILLESTAGQGHSLGYRFEHLAEILAGLGDEDRLGICLDTCHLHAAGYDLSSRQGYEAMMSDFLENLPLERLACIHVNDSKRPAGSRIDRHAHIGAGTIGLAGFRRLLGDRRLAAVPKILETPKEIAPDGRQYDAVNLETLRRLAGG